MCAGGGRVKGQCSKFWGLCVGVGVYECACVWGGITRRSCAEVMCASRDGVLLYSSVPLSPHTFHPPTCCQAGPVRRYAEVDASGQEAADTKPWELLEIPRSREVGQWYITSVWTTLRAMLHAVALVWHVSPQVWGRRRHRRGKGVRRCGRPCGRCCTEGRRRHR